MGCIAAHTTGSRSNSPNTVNTHRATIHAIRLELFARSDRYYIKKFEDKTNLRCHMMVDQSRSMSYGSLPYTKAQYASTLAATLAYFLSLQGDAVGLLTFTNASATTSRHGTGPVTCAT